MSFSKGQFVFLWEAAGYKVFLLCKTSRLSLTLEKETNAKLVSKSFVLGLFCCLGKFCFVILL